ncbi:hypothetical protein O59_000269 [Cellvibrio sp. BR]|nr:hypothetical protein O59_000269 [Cellvibrio sp. BR]
MGPLQKYWLKFRRLFEHMKSYIRKINKVKNTFSLLNSI